MPSISRSSWIVSGEHFNVMRGNLPSERTAPVKILPRTLKQNIANDGAGCHAGFLRSGDRSLIEAPSASGWRPPTDTFLRSRDRGLIEAKGSIVALTRA